MNKERLLKLAEVLRLGASEDQKTVTLVTGEEIKFDLNHWKKQESCGTAACAIGVATMHPWFQKEGLGLERISGWIMNPIFDDESGYDALSKFFDITNGEATKLFHYSGYDYRTDVTPAQVEQKIREFISA